MSSKLFPFWWLNPVVTCDVVKGCLEGSYSSWAEKWVVNIDDGSEYGIGWIDEDAGVIYIRNNVYWQAYNLSDGSKINDDDGLAFYGYGPRMHASLRGKYFAIPIPGNGSRNALWIIIAGVEPDDPQITLDGTNEEINTVIVSPSGKYIVLVTTTDDSAPADNRLHCYEGS